MPDIKRTLRITTEQSIIEGKDSGVEGFPQRRWSIQLQLLDESKTPITASCFDQVTYKLHPSFGDKATQVKKKPPFKIEEEGWGEFEMELVITAGGKDHAVPHDLNFQSPKYTQDHTLTFKNPKEPFLSKLRESGPVPGLDENGVKSKRSGVQDEGSKKKKRVDKSIDMDKLADGLQRLGEDDLLQVVQMVHDNKSADSYTKNDVEQGEFHVDLYTLPDPLIKMLWDFASEKSVLV